MVVAGAGHNSLIATAYLARAGLRCLVLEARSTIGGDTATRHRMPIPGLYQTGATTHPGGSVSGAPGRNAARVLLDDLGIGFAEALAAT